MLNLIWPAILLAGAALVLLLYRYPSLSLWMLGAVVIIDTLTQDQSPALQFLGLNLYLMDLTSVLLSACCLVRLLTSPRQLSGPLWILLLLLAQVLVSALAGAAEFGVRLAGNAARPFLWFLVVTLYVATLPAGMRLFGELRRLLVASSVALLGIAAARWVLVAAGVISAAAFRSVAGDEIRVLNAAQTLLLAETAVLAWYSRRTRRGSPVSAFSMLLLAAVTVMQHRTVWVVALGTILLLLYRERLVRRRVALALIIGTLAAVVGSAILLPGHARQSFGASASDLGNLEWRIQGWTQLLAPQRYSGPAEYAVGHAFGSSYLRGRWEEQIEVAAHNHYLQTFYDLGLLGLALLLALFVTLLRRVGAAMTGSIPAGRTVQALLFMQLIFYVAYSPGFHQGLFLGLAVWCLRHRMPRRTVLRVPVACTPRAWPLGRTRQAIV